MGSSPTGPSKECRRLLNVLGGFLFNKALRGGYNRYMTIQEFGAIVRRNFFTPVVLAIYALALTLLFLGELRDAYFVSVVITVNFAIGVFQETRARIQLQKIELMSAPRARKILESGDVQDILYTELVVGDEIMLTAGDEVPADVEILSSKGLEVDESMLTGESASVDKSAQDVSYAGSAVMAGRARARVIAIGDQTRSGKMTSTLRQYRPTPTPLQKRIDLAISILTYGALGFSLAIAVVYLFMGHDLVSVFKAIVAGAITIIPEGLLLASTLLLVYGSLKLAASQVLSQKVAAIEAMAVVNVLCVDKTGTLTEPAIRFDSFEVFDDKKDSKYYRSMVGIAAQETGGGNSTSEALVAAFSTPKEYKVNDILAFSSERKFSGVRASFKEYEEVIFMGAPEYVGALADVSDPQRARVEDLAAAGMRVLMVVSMGSRQGSLKDLSRQAGGEVIGLLILRNDLRNGVQKTISYLQERGVSVRVISGDNPRTVQFIAKESGINRTEKVITGDELAVLDEEAFAEAARTQTIFARVLPDQKERLVAQMQKQGNFVGMVGDGVNDALALKQSDLGVAMYSGAAATRRVADIVLLNNSFTSLPVGMRIGNRIMQAIEIISTLFFHKIIYVVVLLVATMALGIVFPFQPRHVTFMNIFIVTLPTLMWTFFPPRPRHRVRPLDYWKDTLIAVAPIAVLSGVAITLSYWFLGAVDPDNSKGVVTTTVIITTLLGVYAVFLVPFMLNVVYDAKARVARLLYIVAVVIAASTLFGFETLREFFDFTRPAHENSTIVLVQIIFVMCIQWYLALKARDRLRKRLELPVRRKV